VSSATIVSRNAAMLFSQGRVRFQFASFWSTKSVRSDAAPLIDGRESPIDKAKRIPLVNPPRNAVAIGDYGIRMR